MRLAYEFGASGLSEKYIPAWACGVQGRGSQNRDACYGCFGMNCWARGISAQAGACGSEWRFEGVRGTRADRSARASGASLGAMGAGGGLWLE